MHHQYRPLFLSFTINNKSEESKLLNTPFHTPTQCNKINAALNEPLGIIQFHLENIKLQSTITLVVNQVKMASGYPKISYL